MISSSANNERRFHGGSPTSPSNGSNIEDPRNPLRTNTSFGRRETVCDTPLERFTRLWESSYVPREDNYFPGWYFNHQAATTGNFHEVPLDDDDCTAWNIFDVVPVSTTFHPNENYTSYTIHVRLESPGGLLTNEFGVDARHMLTNEFDVEARNSEFFVVYETVIQVIQSIKEKMGEERMEFLAIDDPLPPPKHWYGSNSKPVVGRRLREWATLLLHPVLQPPKLAFSMDHECCCCWNPKPPGSCVVKTSEEEIVDERKRYQLGLKYLDEIHTLWAEVSCVWVKFFLEHKKEE